MYNLPKKILSWYDNNKRTLPWRVSQNSRKKQYYRLLSEFMLQQTQVKTVIPYFLKFVKKIPNLKILSTTKEKSILKLWEGLGYYRRARNLHQTAKILIKDYNGKLPQTIEELKKLPGIGEYTANALMALVYDQPAIPVDGNVNRIFLRLFNKNIKKNIKKIYSNRNADFAEALMEFGAIICKPKKPLCNICNLKNECKFYSGCSYIKKKIKSIVQERRYDIFCYLNKKREIALTKNKKLTFLNNFKMPEIQKKTSYKNLKKNGWNYLSNYKNNISNIKMNIKLFYKFTNHMPKNFSWHSIDRLENEFIPSFTKKIFKKISKVYT